MANKKRKDLKGRGLRQGEYQRKDGRYEYRFTDKDGNSKSIYSWKLESYDRLPPGKKDEVSLRDRIKQINKDLEDDLAIEGGNYTVTTLVEKYLFLRRDLKTSTQQGYATVNKLLSEVPFGKKRIDTVKMMDAKIFFIELSNKGFSYSHIYVVKNVLRPAFQMAVDDDLIRKNPFIFKLCTVVKDDSTSRQSLSERDMKAFLEFVKNDDKYSKYYEAFYILLHTGLRISEFAGLTLSDLDFSKKIISVNKQLLNNKIETTKTKSSVRKLPMSDDVYLAFKAALKKRRTPKVEPMVDGKVGFLYLSKNSRPISSNTWQHMFRDICKKYNSLHLTQLPTITPHICRHTYCTNMVKAGINPKVLQYLMGHSSIRITLDYYTHIGLEDAFNELSRLKEIGKNI